MKEFEGLELKDIDTTATWHLVFWDGEHASQDVSFDNEVDCDEVLNEIRKGNGIKVNYNFNKETVTVFPFSVLKLKAEIFYSLSGEQVGKLGRPLTAEVKGHIGNNTFQPEKAN